MALYPAQIGKFFRLFPWAEPFIMAQPPTKCCEEFSELLTWDASPGGGIALSGALSG